MAIAGRVAIRPRGTYDATVAYERLDMVKYQNTLYIAKKAVSGVTPVEGEFWMDCGGTDLSNIEKKLAALENPEFTEEEELAALTSEESHTTLWGKVAKAVSSLIAHIGNKNNPHEVTANQVGALTEENISNSTIVTEAGFAADARQLNKEVEDSFAAGVEEEISLLNQGLNNSLNGFKVYTNPKQLGLVASDINSLVEIIDKMPNQSICFFSYGTNEGWGAKGLVPINYGVLIIFLGSNYNRARLRCFDANSDETYTSRYNSSNTNIDDWLLTDQNYIKKRVYNKNSDSAVTGGFITLSFDYALDGYYPIGIQTYFIGNRACSLYNMMPSQMQLQNMSSNTQTIDAGSAYMDIVYVKNKLVTVI